jgi:hypothetical protein
MQCGGGQSPRTLVIEDAAAIRREMISHPPGGRGPQSSVNIMPAFSPRNSWNISMLERLPELCDNRFISDIGGSDRGRS